MDEIKIGVAGYSAQKFDTSEAIKILKEAYNIIAGQFAGKSIVVISGLTDIGIPALAYREAVLRGWRTVGLACALAKDYACFPVDEEIIMGKEWGDESPHFLEIIDVLVRVGGGKQSLKEAAQFKKNGHQVLEYNLPALQK
ncbi:MAG: hypothetical protein ABUK01_09950 [Leptospirales bacterium]